MIQGLELAWNVSSCLQKTKPILWLRQKLLIVDYLLLWWSAGSCQGPTGSLQKTCTISEGVLWVECLSSGLEFLQDLKVCMFVFCFQWGIQAWASKCFVCIFLFSALFVNRSAQKLKHMHVLSCSSFSVFLCGTVLHLKVEQSEYFFSVVFFVFGYAVRSLKTANT